MTRRKSHAFDSEKVGRYRIQKIFRNSQLNQHKKLVAVTFSENPVMTRRKSHAFDSEKVGRYRIQKIFRNSQLNQHKKLALSL